jgi:hypothetical protein
VSGGAHAAPRPRWSWRSRIVATVVLVVLALGVVMVILALPLVSARTKAKAAQSELEAAKTALSAQQFPASRDHVRAARADVTAAEGDLHGFGAGLWASVPVVGSAVTDARHLVDALSQTTTVAQIGVKIYPSVVGPTATLVQGERIDLPTLATVVKQTQKIGGHLHKALAQLHQVSGSTPLVGGSVASARDAALGQLQPVSDSYARTLPLLKATPAVLGVGGPRTYLLAMLNPAELRYSGGGALSFTTIGFNQGQAVFGKTINVDQINARGQFLSWPGVPGDPLHRTPDRLTNATFSPYWSVAGEELLRAWGAAYHQHLDGVIAVDVQALAGLFALTGPVDVPGHPPLTSANLVQTLAGSYRTTTKQQRRAVNAALVPAFRTKFFQGGDTQKKLSSLLNSANGRHFATYFRDPAVEQKFAAAGLSGNLSSSPNDYLGVFSQNLNGSKTDYFQHRTLVSNVKIHDDGSAWVTLRASIQNASAPYTGPPPVPLQGYLTARLATSVAFFLPAGTEIGSVTFKGRRLFPTPVQSTVSGIYNRPFVRRSMSIPAGKTRHVVLRYKVPHAVTTVGGQKMYSFAIDPQDTVVPEGLQLTVEFPSGLTPTSLPAGWVSASPGTASYTNTAVTSSMSFDVPLSGG